MADGNTTLPSNQQQALRRIDALVAEHVMGWISAGDDPFHQWGDKGPMWCEMGRSWIRLPDFTTSWDAAGQVIERMRESGWFWQGSMNEPSGFYSEFSKLADPKYKPASMAIGDTLPLAVSLAALRACGVQVDEVTG
jgi:hypothetical protein